MINDLCISKIENVYFGNPKDWKRTEFAPRHKDALVLLTEGEIEYFFSHGSVLAKRGTLLLLPGNMPYSGIRRTENVAYFVLDFKCQSDDMVEKLAGPTALTPENYDKLVSDFSEISELWKKQQIDVHFKIKAFLYSTLCEVLANRAEQRSGEPVYNVLSYIVAHLSEPWLTVHSLCEKFYISESQLRRNVIKATGYTPNEYICMLRINLAKNELIHTAKTVKTIAEECGFTSPYYFSRSFHARIGTSPKEYRRQNSML